MFHKKYMANTIWSGLVHTKFKYSDKSRNFCVSICIKLVVSPTGTEQYVRNGLELFYCKFPTLSVKIPLNYLNSGKVSTFFKLFDTMCTLELWKKKDSVEYLESDFKIERAILAILEIFQFN